MILKLNLIKGRGTKKVMMNKRINIKRVAGCFLTTVIMATSITGCGKNNKDKVEDAAVKELSGEIPEASKDGCIFKAEAVDGILKDGESVKYLDYVGGKIRVVASNSEEKVRYISFNEDGSDVQSVDIPIDGENLFAYYAADEEGNLYAHIDRFTIKDDVDPEEQEGVAHAGYEDDSFVEEEDPEAAGSASMSASVDEGPASGSYERLEYAVAKFDSTGKEVFKNDISKEFSVDDMYSGIYSMHWIKGYGLVFNTSRGIEKYDEKAGFSVIIDISEINKFSDTVVMLFEGAGDKLILQSYKDNVGSEYRPVDLEHKKVGEPYKGFDSEKFYTFSGGEGYDIYANDERVIYGFDSKEDKLVEVLDLKNSEIDGFVDPIVAVNDKEFFAIIPGIDGIMKLTEAEE